MNRQQRRAAGASAPGGMSPAFVETFNAAMKAQNEGQFERAIAGYREAAKFNSRHPLLYNNLGVVYYTMGNWDEAVVNYRKAIALDPNMPLALNNLAVTLNSADRHDEAIPIFQHSLKFQPGNPKALNNLGDSFNKTGRFAEAKPLIEQALAAVPDYAEGYSNYGMTLWGLGDLDAAIAAFKRAIALQPDLAMPHKNLGLVYLLIGNYAEGWRDYLWRQAADHIPARPNARPLWQGQDLGDGALLVFAEQGVGDEILYANMMQDLVERGVNVVWEADQRLLPLFRRSYPTIRFIERTWPVDPAVTPADIVAQCPIGTLGTVLRTDVARFATARFPVLQPDLARVAALRAQTGVADNEKLIGMSWLSKNPRFGNNKSTALTDWADAIRVPGVKFVNLQYGDTLDERQRLTRDTGLALIHLDGLDLTADLDGVAALAAACDHVITVSNTAAHIAGAVGTPLQILVPEGMGKLWYWGNGTETTPWYPQARFFRQDAQSHWQPIMRQVVELVQKISRNR